MLIFPISLCLKEGHDAWSCCSHPVAMRHKPIGKDDGTGTKEPGSFIYSKAAKPTIRPVASGLLGMQSVQILIVKPLWQSVLLLANHSIFN